MGHKNQRQCYSKHGFIAIKTILAIALILGKLIHISQLLRRKKPRLLLVAASME
jgi:hypothetical protein